MAGPALAGLMYVDALSGLIVLIVALPVGLLVTAILHGNEWRDVAEDTRHGFTTFSAQVGRDAAHWVYVMLILGAYVAVGLGVMVGALPKLALLTLFSLPLVAWILRDAERGAEGHLRAIAMIDLMTARLHGAFGALAFGIGTSEVEHVLATQTLPLKPFKTMAITVDGTLRPGVTRICSRCEYSENTPAPWSMMIELPYK